eukprot:341905-Chlamydomonas_euryale.AAC.1
MRSARILPLLAESHDASGSIRLLVAAVVVNSVDTSRRRALWRCRCAAAAAAAAAAELYNKHLESADDNWVEDIVTITLVDLPHGSARQ